MDTLSIGVALTRRSVLCAVLLIVSAASTVRAQEVAPRPAALTVFLDCSVCDFTFLRQRIDWIDWVRDARAAEVHLLITARSSAASVEHKLEFLGREKFLGQDQVLTVSTSVTDSPDAQRQQLARVIAVGLARYAVQTSGGRLLEVRPGFDAGAGVASAKDDPWNFWIMSMGVSGYFSREARTDSLQLSASVSANRTTDAWKVRFLANTIQSESNFEFDDGESFKSTSGNSDGSVQVVRSIGKNWGVGMGGSAQSATFTNIKLSYRAAGAVEYNVFPYTESSDRLLTLTYFAGLTRFNYEEETIFGVSHELLLNQGVLLRLDLTRPWGSSSVDIQAKHFPQHKGQYRMSVDGSMSYRIARGLDAEVFAGYSIVRDQRYLARRGVSDEEVLVRRRALRTDSSVSVTFGLSYTFGSIYNRTVNTRLTGPGGRFERVF